jgi:hypothetical protein
VVQSSLCDDSCIQTHPLLVLVMGTLIPAICGSFLMALKDVYVSLLAFFIISSQFPLYLCLLGKGVAESRAGR